MGGRRARWRAVVHVLPAVRRVRDERAQWGGRSFLGGNDGCNWYGAGGSLDGDRLRVAEVASTAMDCGAGVGGVLPQDGDRVSLSDGGRTLDLIGADDRVRLRLSRLESLAAAAPDTLTGRWVLDGGAPGPLEFGSDWSGGLGSCRWGWELGQSLVVSGWPADPYACLDGSDDQASSRLVEMLVGGGPVAARPLRRRHRPLPLRRPVRHPPLSHQRWGRPAACPRAPSTFSPAGPLRPPWCRTWRSCPGCCRASRYPGPGM